MTSFEIFSENKLLQMTLFETFANQGFFPNFQRNKQEMKVSSPFFKNMNC